MRPQRAQAGRAGVAVLPAPSRMVGQCAHASVDVERRDLLRARQRAREAVLRREQEDGAVPPAQRQDGPPDRAEARRTPQTGDEVAYEDIVKGYELTKDRYVVITPDELEALDPEKSRTIDIEDFVDLADIDPVYYDHPYYLVPDKGAAKAYGLLLDAMRESGKVAIARVVIRSKEQLVAIRPAPGGVLMMETMIFADEVVPPEPIDDLPDAEDLKVSDRELKMAQQLIDSLSSDFEPEKYQDEYREKVLELIERKAVGRGDRRPARGARSPAKVPDLMAALEASLAAVKGDGDGKGEAGQGRGRSASRRARRPRRSRSALGRVAVELEPDAGLGRRGRCPSGRRARARGRGPSPRAAPGRARARRARSRGPGRRPRRASPRSSVSTTSWIVSSLVEPGVADGVGDELGDEQLRVLEPARREMVGRPRPAPGAPRRRSRDRGRGRPRASRLPASPRAGPSTNSSRSRMRVMSNTRITCCRAGDERKPAAAFLRVAGASRAITRRPLESMKSTPRRSSTTRVRLRPRARSSCSSACGAGEVELARRARSRRCRPATDGGELQAAHAAEAYARAGGKNRRSWRRACDARTAPAPGSGAVRRGRGFALRRRRGRARRRARGAGADRRARRSRRRGRTSGSARTPAATSRPPAPTRPAASSTATTTPGASGATARSSTTWSASPGAAAAAPARRARTSATARRSTARACSPAPCGCSSAASSASAPRSTRSRTSPTGSRRCARSTSRIDDDGDDGLRLPGQERPARVTGRRSTTRVRAIVAGAQAPPRRRRRSCSPTRRAAAGRRAVGRHQRVPQGGDGRRLLRQGLPHLERDRARRGRARRLRRGRAPTKTARKRAVSPRDQGGRRSYLGNTPAVCRASYIDPRVFDALPRAG